MNVYDIPKHLESEATGSGISQFRSVLTLANTNVNQMMTNNVQPLMNANQAMANIIHPSSSYYGHMLPYGTQMNYWPNKPLYVDKN